MSKPKLSYHINHDTSKPEYQHPACVGCREVDGVSYTPATTIARVTESDHSDEGPLWIMVCNECYLDGMMNGSIVPNIKFNIQH